MIIFINLFKKLINKSPNYQLVWMFIFSKFTDNDECIEISIFEIQVKYKIPKSTIYSILNFGFEYFDEINYSKKFFLKKNIIFIKKRENLLIPQTRKTRIVKSISIDKKLLIKSKKATQALTNEYDEIIEKIINFLNINADKKFTITNYETKSVIINRLKDGFLEEDFYKIIIGKCKQWKNTFNDKHLRPITLFGDKMEYYLQEKEIISEIIIKSQTQSTYDTINKSKELLANQYSKKTD